MRIQFSLHELQRVKVYAAKFRSDIAHDAVPEFVVRGARSESIRPAPELNEVQDFAEINRSADAPQRKAQYCRAAAPAAGNVNNSLGAPRHATSILVFPHELGAPSTTAT